MATVVICYGICNYREIPMSWSDVVRFIMLFGIIPLRANCKSNASKVKI